MKLKEYLSLQEPGTEVTCWDHDIDSEFYFYSEDPELEEDSEFRNCDVCMERFAEVLDVLQIHNGGVEVDLYQVLSHPKIVQYAKDNFYTEHQYEEDDDVVMLLFDDNVKNFSSGFLRFSTMMIECLDKAFHEGVVLQQPDINQPDEVLSFIDDAEKMRDFNTLSKEEFLASYSYLTEEEYEATQRMVEKTKLVQQKSVEGVLADAQSRADKNNSDATTEKNKFYKASDGFFDYYVNLQTGEKKFKLEENDVLVERNMDDFIR